MNRYRKVNQEKLGEQEKPVAINYMSRWASKELGVLSFRVSKRPVLKVLPCDNRSEEKA
jgi:hypothetical protein